MTRKMFVFSLCTYLGLAALSYGQVLIIKKPVSASRSINQESYIRSQGDAPHVSLDQVGIYALMHLLFEHESPDIRKQLAGDLLNRGFSQESLIHLKSLLANNPYLKQVSEQSFSLSTVRAEFNEILNENTYDFVHYIESDFDTYETVILNTVINDLLKEGVTQWRIRQGEFDTIKPYLVQHFSLVELSTEAKLRIHTISLRIFIESKIKSVLLNEHPSSVYRSFPVSVPNVMNKFQILPKNAKMPGFFFASSQIEAWHQEFK